jgi:hypothetical protein
MSVQVCEFHLGEKLLSFGNEKSLVRLQLGNKHTVNGIHYLQRTVGVLVFQSVVDELHVGLEKAGFVRSSYRSR